MTNENLLITLAEAKLPGRIISMQAKIGDTLVDLCARSAYDLSKLKGVGDNVIEDTREILAFYGLNLSGDPECEIVEGAEHPIVAAYRTRLEKNYPGMAAKLGTLSDREVGEEFGVSAQSVNNHRRMLGIAKAQRVSLGSKKDRRIAALESAINEAIALSLSQEARQFPANPWEGIMRDLLTAALKNLDATAASDGGEAAMTEESSDDSDDSEEAQAPGDEGDEAGDEVEAAADESTDDEADEADESSDESSDNGNVFQFGESDFDTTAQQDDDESDTKPVGGSLTFS